MALGYAEKLSYREDVGKVGMPELFDSRNDLQTKIEELSKLIKESHHLVAFTGAGISTSCGIPDFRGPKGVWTLQHEGKPIPKGDLPFHQARPGITHMALVALQRAGILKFVISQNIDGLHLKSGLPRECLSELHGCSFREVCSSCGKEYLRDFEVETIGLKNTGRRCSDPSCSGKLKDTVLDWEDALPPEELVPAEKHCKDSDLVICLGTSLQITPACNLPLRSVRAGGKMVIINLQATPKDKKAALVIRARVDEVISGVLERLCLSIPPFVRIDRVRISWFYSTKSRNRTARWTLRVDSSHGKNCPMPFVESVEVSFPDRTDLKNATLKERPFVLRRSTVKIEDFYALVKLNFGEGCMCGSACIRHPLKFKVESENSAPNDNNEVFDTIKTNEAEPENSVPNDSNNVIDMMKTNELESKDEPENSVQNDNNDVFDTMKTSGSEPKVQSGDYVPEDNKETSDMARAKSLELKVERENKIIDMMKTRALEAGSLGYVVPLNANIEDVEGVFVTEYAIVTCIIKYGSDALESQSENQKQSPKSIKQQRESPKRSCEDSEESPSKRSKIECDKG